ncbi:MAG: tRNA (N6-threonylcarbamoyladenosine(37)-N6)-methyltransferase TrmO [Candidatus Goldiibacteriota bacterium]
MKLEKIGYIRSPHKEPGKGPIQPSKTNAKGQVVVYKKFEEGLSDIEGFSHIILIYRFHRIKGYRLLVKPFQDTKLRGVFAARAPRRPNRIGISIVKLIKRNKNILYIDNIDAVDNSPLLDIKPFIPEFEPDKKFRTGWRKGIK